MTLNKYHFEDLVKTICAVFGTDLKQPVFSITGFVRLKRQLPASLRSEHYAGRPPLFGLSPVN